jgi:hypothetical protein
MASLMQAAAHLFMSEQTFRKYLDKGIFTAAPRGGYNIDKLREEYIRHLWERANRTGPRWAAKSSLDDDQEETREKIDPDYEDALTKRAKRQREELRLKREQGELVPVAEIHRADEAMLSTLRDRLLMIGMNISEHVYEAAVTGDRNMIKDVIDGAVNEALADVSEARVITNEGEDDDGGENQDFGLLRDDEDQD